MYNINSLNAEQLKPAKNTEGAFLVTAGAGSGKTRLLTHRICYLINDLGVNPNNILAITFTNKATNEMKERIADMCPMGEGVWISTFHSMCSKILRENIWHFGCYTKYFTIYDTSDKDKIIKRILSSLNISDTDLKNKISGSICEAKNNGYSPEEYFNLYRSFPNAELTYQVYSEYENTLKQNNALDFDDLLCKTLQLFVQFPEVLNYYQTLFKYIHVDEFQDTNLVQYKLVKLLADKYKNIFVVGDEDQCIYGWRGANIENIFNFKNDFPNCTCYKLEQNYRSTKSILKTANTLIKNNSQRLEKNLWTDNVEGELPKLFVANNEDDEAEYVANKINLLVKNNGYKASDIAVLMRLSAFSRNFEEKLLNYNIPYVVTGIFKFFDRLEIKNIMAYLRVLVNNNDAENILRIINVPKRGIGEASCKKLLDLAKENNETLYNVIVNNEEYNIPKALKDKLKSLKDVFVETSSNLDKMGLSDFVKFVIDKTEIKGMYNTNSEEDIDRTYNIDQLINSVINYEHKNEDATLLTYLESITLENALTDEEDEETDKVNISTIHASKGLEYKVIFIVGTEEGCFPISRAFDSDSEMEEERRLMYVAITRAKERLYITCAKSRFLYGKRQPSVKSRFLKEMDILPKVSDYSSTFSNYNYSLNNVNTSNNNFYSGLNKINRNANYNSLQEKPKTQTFSKVETKTASSDKFKNYVVGASVRHAKFGVGVITKIETSPNNTFATINFSGYGSKTLSLNFAPLELV